MTKHYDREYFDRWYRNRGTRVISAAETRRKAALAIATAEYFLRRPVRDALDIGCGEGAWRSPLRTIRPGLHYQGLDPSGYAVERFGKTRGLRQASIAELPSLRLRPHDLVVCADVLHYVEDSEIEAAAAEVARLTLGIAYIEVLTAEDDIVGDLAGLIRRPAAWYRAQLT
ncbi:MAG: class I SAM-dependent methyltransferase, partial [Thermoanaerobaculia bacterium]